MDRQEITALAGEIGKQLRVPIRKIEFVASRTGPIMFDGELQLPEWFTTLRTADEVRFGLARTLTSRTTVMYQGAQFFVCLAVGILIAILLQPWIGWIFAIILAGLCFYALFVALFTAMGRPLLDRAEERALLATRDLDGAVGYTRMWLSHALAGREGIGPEQLQEMFAGAEKKLAEVAAKHQIV